MLSGQALFFSKKWNTPAGAVEIGCFPCTAASFVLGASFAVLADILIKACHVFKGAVDRDTLEKDGWITEDNDIWKEIGLIEIIVDIDHNVFIEVESLEAISVLRVAQADAHAQPASADQSMRFARALAFAVEALQEAHADKEQDHLRAIGLAFLRSYYESLFVLIRLELNEFIKQQVDLTHSER